MTSCRPGSKQWLARMVAAKSAAQPWWDRLQHLNDMASRLEDECDDELPPEFHQAQTACLDQIAAAYRQHGI